MNYVLDQIVKKKFQRYRDYTIIEFEDLNRKIETFLSFQQCPISESIKSFNYKLSWN